MSRLKFGCDVPRAHRPHPDSRLVVNAYLGVIPTLGIKGQYKSDKVLFHDQINRSFSFKASGNNRTRASEGKTQQAALQKVPMIIKRREDRPEFLCLTLPSTRHRLDIANSTLPTRHCLNSTLSQLDIASTRQLLDI